MRLARVVILAFVSIIAYAQLAEAQAQCFIGQIRFFAGPFVPSGHDPADGRLLPIPRSNVPPDQQTPEERAAAPIYALLGTTYGGSATTFALPDLRGRAPLGVGDGPTTTPRALGETGGVETVTLGIPEMPSHSHDPFGTDDPAVSVIPQDNVWGGKARLRLYGPPTALAPMSPTALEPDGGGQPVDNMTPFMALHAAMCRNGVFPQRPE